MVWTNGYLVIYKVFIYRLFRYNSYVSYIVKELTKTIEFYYSNDRSAISSSRKYYVTFLNANNHSSTNMVKSLVNKFKTLGTVTDHQ